MGPVKRNLASMLRVHLLASTFTFALLFTKVSPSPANRQPHKNKGPSPQKDLSSSEWGSIESVEGIGNDYVDESGEIGANSSNAKDAKEKSEVSGGEVDGHLGGEEAAGGNETSAVPPAETSAGGNETSAVNPPSVHKKFHQKVHMGNETEAGGNETTAVGGKEPKADLEDESKGLKGKESYGYGGGDGGFAALAKLSKAVNSLHKITSNLGTGKGH